MQSAAYHLSIRTARADALFASALQQSDESSAALVQQAIIAAVRAFGTRGCAARVARAYGERTVTLSVQGRRLLRDQWEIRCRGGSGRRRGPRVSGRGGRGCGTVVCWRWPGPLPDRYAVRARPEAGCMP